MSAPVISPEPCGFVWREGDEELVCEEGGRHLCQPRAVRAAGFYRDVLVHTKGRFARKKFLLADWQREEIVRPLFGTVRWEDQLEEYVRQYTLAWLELARKNGKSELVAGGGLFLLVGDDEEEAEVYGAAKDRDQAAIVYQVAKRMVELSPLLSKRLTVIDSKKRIIDPKTGSFYQVVASDAGGNLGKNPSGILFDEVITQPNRELWDDLKTGAGARDQTMMIAATTAGNDPSSMAAEEHLHSERVAADPSVDPARFVFMRNTPADADWTDEANWYHANPGLGDFLRIQVLRDEAKEAELSPRKQNTFRQFRLNQWVRQVTRWLDMGLWDENAGLVVPEKLKGLDAYGGLDLASTSDFAAWLLVFPGAIREAGGVFADGVLARFWLPQAAVEARKDMAPLLKAWAREGFLSITPGDVISFGDIRRQIDLDMRSFRVRRIGYDRWSATELTQWMQARLGEDQVVGVTQTTSALNAPSKELERRLGLRQLRHGGHPVLRWMADNVQAFTDSGGNIKPDRKNSKEKIDGIAALVDALFVEMMPKQAAFAFVLS
jgi:phage terminase large subunit-like protein